MPLRTEADEELELDTRDTYILFGGRGGRGEVRAIFLKPLYGDCSGKLK